jgi:hypothetical protein
VFSGKQTEFADWWRIMLLFLKFNNVIQAKQKIALVAFRMEGGVPGFHAKQWQERIIKGGDTASWDKLEEETKQAFGLGNEEELARNQIKEFKQENQHINDYLIKFSALAEMAGIDNLHAIFLLKQHTKHSTSAKSLAT